MMLSIIIFHKNIDFGRLSKIDCNIDKGPKSILIKFLSFIYRLASIQYFKYFFVQLSKKYYD